MREYLSLFKKKNLFYYNYTLDKKFKFKIYKDKLILLEKKKFFIFDLYQEIYSSKKKNIQERWKVINKIILKKNSNINFLLYNSIKSY
jgi:hypothetical protein